MLRNAAPLFFALIVIGIPTHGESLDEARALYRKGDFAGAIKLYQSFLQQNPRSEQAHLGLVRALWKKDDIQEAHKTAEMALGSFPDSAPLLAAKGDILFRMAQISEAQTAYSKAVRLDPQNARGYWGLGNILALDFNRKSAREMRRKAYKCDPEDSDIIVDYATDLPAKEQIPLLEKYLSLATNDIEEKRNSIAELIRYLKKVGDMKTWKLNGPPKAASIPLKSIMHSVKTGVTGFKLKAFINNEKKIDLQLDTGASGLSISRKLAEKLKLEIISASHVRGLGDDGSRKAFRAWAPVVNFGPVEFHNCILTVTDKKLLEDTEGLIGPGIFSQFLMTLNFPQQKLELQPLPAIDGKPFDDPQSWKELDRTRIPQLSDFAPMGGWGHLLIPTTINDKKSGYFWLDTGAAVNIISREFAEEIMPLRPVGKWLRGLSGPAESYVAWDVKMRIGRFFQNQKYMAAVSLKEMSHTMGFEIAGLLGHPLLSQLVITIDYRDGLIEFVYPREKRP